MWGALPAAVDSVKLSSDSWSPDFQNCIIIHAHCCYSSLGIRTVCNSSHAGMEHLNSVLFSHSAKEAYVADLMNSVFSGADIPTCVQHQLIIKYFVKDNHDWTGC